MIPLPSNFSLGPNDVLCGRTRDCSNRTGNQRFTKLVQEHLPQYIMAATRMDKSKAILTVIHHVEERSCGGGFVRYDPLMKQYYRVSEKIAREKTSQAFRELLKRPSNPGKQLKYVQARAKETRRNSSLGSRKSSVSNCLVPQRECAVSEYWCDSFSNLKKAQDVTEFGSISTKESESNPILSDAEFWRRFQEMDLWPEKNIEPSISTSIYHHGNTSEERFISQNAFGFDFSFSGSGSKMGANMNTVVPAKTSRNNDLFEDILGNSYDNPFEPLPLSSKPF